MLYPESKVANDLGVLIDRLSSVFSARLLERTLAVDICLSVRLSVRLSNAWTVTKRNNSLSIYQHCTIEGFF